MRFKSEASRMAHPYAKLIPFYYWNHYSFFCDKLSDTSLHLMQTTSAELQAHVQAIVALRPSPEKAKCYWIAIACSHHDLNDMDLYHIALQLKIAKENLFIMASAVGKRGIVQQLLYDKSQNSVDWNEIKHKRYMDILF